MTRKTSGYLRLHVEEALSPERPRLEEVRSLAAVCEAFHQVTGWTIRLCGEPEDREDGCWSQHIADQEGRDVGRLILDAPDDGAFGGHHGGVQLRADREAIQDLAAGVAGLVRELYHTRRALWQREAELAAGVPIAAHADEEAHLATRLEAVLKAGAQAVHCQAAAAYMLDEATKQLKLRSCWGLPKSRFLDAPRTLRGAAADLEALVGHAVVLEDTRLMANWKVPEEFRSAVCVPISSPTVPLGTLWMFSDAHREFTVHETNLIEIVAGRLAADLEREMLLQQTLQSKKFNRQLAQAAACQRSRLPRIKPLLAGWQVAGWTAQRDYLGGDFHDWFVLPDGALAIAVGDAQGKMFEAGFTCATVQTALKSHAGYRHSAQQMVERVNETLWTASTGDQFASLFYGLIQPVSGEIEQAVAGHIHPVILGDAVRSLAVDVGPPLGTQPDSEYPASRDRLGTDEILVVLSEGLQKSLQDERKRDFWNLIRQHRRACADDLICKVEGLLDEFHDHQAGDDQTILIVKRETR
jgi:sigma-B regulation protein RsbU (phosphoserine phosphatase)